MTSVDWERWKIRKYKCQVKNVDRRAIVNINQTRLHLVFQKSTLRWGSCKDSHGCHDMRMNQSMATPLLQRLMPNGNSFCSLSLESVQQVHWQTLLEYILYPNPTECPVSTVEESNNRHWIQNNTELHKSHYKMVWNFSPIQLASMINTAEDSILSLV